MHKLTLKSWVSLITLISFLGQAIAVPMQSSQDLESSLRPSSPVLLKQPTASEDTALLHAPVSLPSEKEEIYGGNGFLGVGEQVIPLDILRYIFSNLSLKDQGRMGAVCQLWRKELEEISGGKLSLFTRGVYTREILEEVRKNIHEFLTPTNFVMLLENPAVLGFLLPSMIETFKRYKDEESLFLQRIDPLKLNATSNRRQMLELLNEEKVSPLVPLIQFFIRVSNASGNEAQELSAWLNMSEDNFEQLQIIAIGLNEIAEYSYYGGLHKGYKESRLYGSILLGIKNALERPNLEEFSLLLSEEVLAKAHVYLTEGRDHWLPDIWSYIFEPDFFHCLTILQEALKGLVKAYCREDNSAKALCFIQKYFPNSLGAEVYLSQQIKSHNLLDNSKSEKAVRD